MPFTPRVKVWLESDGDYVFGHGMAEILQAVDRHGSIKQAAKELGKSYRYVWGRIKEAEAALGETLVDAHVGGAGVQRSGLTPRARELVAAFVSLRKGAQENVQREFTRLFGRRRLNSSN